MNTFLWLAVGGAVAAVLYLGVYYGLWLIRYYRSPSRLPPSDDLPNRLGAVVAGMILIMGLGANMSAHTRLTQEGPTVAKKADVKKLEEAVQKAWCSGNYLEAVEAANALTAASPNSGLAYHVRGLCYEQSGDMDEARKEFVSARNLRYPPTLAHLVQKGMKSLDGGAAP